MPGWISRSGLSHEDGLAICEKLKAGSSFVSLAKEYGVSKWVIKGAMASICGTTRATDLRPDLRRRSLPDQNPDEVAARDFLESVRWPDGARCPTCGGVATREGGKSGAAGRLGCRSCGRSFTVFTDSGLMHTRCPRRWVLYLAKRLTNNPRRVSQYEMARMIDVSPQTVWGLVLRLRAIIRKACGAKRLSGAYSQKDFWRDLEKLRRKQQEHCSSLSDNDARLRGLLVAVFGAPHEPRPSRAGSGKFGVVKNAPISYKGRTQTAQEWADELGFDRSTILARLWNGWDMADVVRKGYRRRRASKTLKFTVGQVSIMKAMLASGRRSSEIRRVYGASEGMLWAIGNGSARADVLAARLLPCVNGGKPTEGNRYVSKIEEIDVQYILCCRERGLSLNKIAARVGIGQATVWSIIQGKSWKKVPREKV